jgi:hypothetical protein
MNPFDLKAALLAKHAQHPVIIHFPIALFIISVAFDLFGIWRSNPARSCGATPANARQSNGHPTRKQRPLDPPEFENSTA